MNIKKSTKKTRGQRGKGTIKNQNNLDVLCERFYSLTSNMKTSEIESLTSVPSSTINALQNGKRQNPNVDNLISIAKAFNCSIDYLVGLTNHNTTNIDDIEICKRTGLSIESLDILSFVNKNEEYKTILNEILEGYTICEIMPLLVQYLNHLPTKDDASDLRVNEKDEILLRRISKELATYKTNRPITSESRKQLSKYYKNQISSIDKKIKELEPKFKIVSLKEKLSKEDIEIRNKYFDLIGEFSELTNRLTDSNCFLNFDDMKEDKKNGKK